MIDMVALFPSALDGVGGEALYCSFDQIKLNLQIIFNLCKFYVHLQLCFINKIRLPRACYFHTAKNLNCMIQFPQKFNAFQILLLAILL